MQKFVFSLKLQRFRLFVRSLLTSVSFYTLISVPNQWQGDFARIARFAPWIGLLIGSILGLTDWILQVVHIPILTSSVLIITLEIGITGGLHLDGAIDTADGLAVTNPEKRLEVMKDSVTGAFGAMAVAVILLLKIAALSDLTHRRWLALMLAASWARWGQVLAIAFYPYLRKEGKGAFHKQNFKFWADITLGFFCVIGCTSLVFWLEPAQWWKAIEIALISSAIVLLVGYWFYDRFKGHTGDTYGAVVEWSEAFILCALTSFDFT